MADRALLRGLSPLLGRMSFRRRLTVAGAVAVAIAVVLAAAITYVMVRGELRGQLDDDLRQTASRLTQRFTSPIPPGLLDGPVPAPAPGGLPTMIVKRLEVPPQPLGGAAGYAQIVTGTGRVVQPPDTGVVLRPTAEAKRVAREGGSAFADATVDGTHVRVLTTALESGAALQLARPADEVDAVLERLAWILALVALAGVGLAGALGHAVTRAALRPVTELTEAAEHVARTRDLSRRIAAPGEDELGRLASAFNEMLGELDSATRSQRQLVADASHELRTPLTSLRTNLEVLAASDAIGAPERERLIGDVVGQLEDLSLLVGDLVELARDDEPTNEATETVRLDVLVGEAVECARRRHPERSFAVALEPTLVEGVPARIDRAVANLLDNAQKWSPDGTTVEVEVREGRTVVRDHGPGIAAADLPRVFDRFYRAPAARGTPGSGLGLAIVRAVADSHGGSASARSREGGGAELTLALPPVQAREPSIS